MNPIMVWLLWALGAYMLGSIPFGLLLGLSRGIDIRQHGSKNIGATNAGRVLGKWWGKLCFALDVLKGAIPVLLSGSWMGTLGSRELPAEQACWWLAVAVAALVGHMFPVYIGFKGGKGVATGFGVMLATWPAVTVPALIALVVWVIVLKLTRYVSVSSCVAACALPLSLAGLRLAGWPSSGWANAVPYLAVTALLAAMVVWKHRPNIARVRAGTEPKVGSSGTPRTT